MCKDSIMLFEKTKVSESLRMENMCDAYGFYWFTSFYYNALFKMDKESWKAQYVCSFPEENSKMRMYSKIVLYGMKLYCIPLSADSIGIYDIALNECKSIRIEEPKRKGEIIYKENSKFIDAVCDNDYLYLLPHTYPAVVRMSFSDGKIDYYYRALADLKSFESPLIPRHEFYFGRFTQSAGNIWVFSNTCGNLCRFDLPEVKFKRNDCIQISGVVVAVSVFPFIWIYSLEETAIYKINIDTKEQIKITDLPENFVPGSFSVTRGIYYEDWIYFVPGTANQTIKVNIETNEVSFAEELCPGVIETNLKNEIWKFGLLEKLDEKIYAFDASDNQLIEYDIRSRKRRKEAVSIDFSDEKTEQWIDEYFLFGEKDTHRVRDLNSLLKLLAHMDSLDSTEGLMLRENMDNSLNGVIGQSIYRKIAES